MGERGTRRPARRELTLARFSGCSLGKVPIGVDPKRAANGAEHFVRPLLALFERPCGIDDEVGESHLLGKGFLRPDASEGVFLRSRVSHANACQLDVFGARDDDERPKPVLRPVLDDERRLVAGNRLAGPGELVRPLHHSCGDSRMGDRLKPTPCARVGEHDGSEGWAIQRAVWPEHVRTESECDLAKALTAYSDDLACELVRVDYGNAARPQSGRDCTFSRCDAPGETEDVHACLVLYTFFNEAKRESQTRLERRGAGRR